MQPADYKIQRLSTEEEYAQEPNAGTRYEKGFSPNEIVG
jgi:hypothetical protein